MPEKIYLAYVRRYFCSDPSSSVDVLSGVATTEDLVHEWLADAEKVGHEMVYEEIEWRDPAGKQTANRNTRAVILFSRGFAQHNPLALELSDPVGVIAFTDFPGLSDLRKVKLKWDFIWTLPVPWESPYLVGEFPRSSYEGVAAGKNLSV